MAVCLELFLMLVILTTAMGCMLSGYQIVCHKKLLFGGMLAAGILLYTCFRMKKGGYWLLAGSVLIYAGLIIWQRASVSAGLATVANEILEKAGAYYHYVPQKYQVVSENPLWDASMYLLVLAIFLEGIVVYLLAHQTGTWLALGITLAMVLSPEIVGLVPGKWWLTAYGLAVLSYLGSGKVKGKKQERLGKMSIQWKVRLFQLVAGGLAVILCLKSIPEAKYVEITANKTWKQSIQYVGNSIYNNVFRYYLDRGTVHGGINFGNMQNVEEIQYSDQVMLRVTAPDTLDPCYLRGYVGSRYENNQWETLDSSSEKKRRELEEKVSPSSEEYGLYVEDSLEKLDQFYGYWGWLDGIYNSASKTRKVAPGSKNLTYLKQPYSREEYLKYKEKKETWYDGLHISDMKIENVSETLKTVFCPYFQLSGIVENNQGRFSAEELANRGEYSCSFADYPLCCIPNPVINANESVCSYSKWLELGYIETPDIRADMDLLWNNCFEDIEQVENVMGFSVKDYKEGTYEGQSLREVSPELCQRLGDTEPTIEELEYSEDYFYRGLRADADADAYFSCLKNAYTAFEKQQQYEEFVKETYTEVPEQISDMLQKKMAQIGVSANTDIYQAIDKVQSYLAEETRYTLAPGKAPEGQDFAAYFLEENKKGFCVHYATAATLLFRSIGVPARYVEGYYLNPIRMTAVEKDIKARTATYELTDRNAHAWVEIYLSGFGWIPAEFTRGYAGSVQNMDQEEEVEQEEPKSREETETPVPTATSTAQTATLQPTQAEQDSQGFALVQFLKQYQAVFITIIGCFCVILAIWLRKKLVWLYRKRRLKNSDPNGQVALYCFRMEKMLYRMQQKRKLTLDVAIPKKQGYLRELLTEQIPEIEGMEPESLERLLAILNRQAFSRTGATKEDAKQCGEIYMQLRTCFYKKLGFFQKRICEYFRVI